MSLSYGSQADAYDLWEWERGEMESGRYFTHDVEREVIDPNDDYYESEVAYKSDDDTSDAITEIFEDDYLDDLKFSIDKMDSDSIEINDDPYGDGVPF